jgi:hypothetical protein
MNSVVDSYPSVNESTQESIYWLVFFPLQNPTSDLIRQVIEIWKIRRRGHGDTSAGKNDERTVLLRLQKAIRNIHVSYAHTSLIRDRMLKVQNDRL